MVEFQRKAHYDYQDLLQIMTLLRSPGGCPWDREQDHDSLRRDLMEETCEVLDAIERKDRAGLCEELGDLLLQVVFHAELEREQGRFSMDEVIDGICRKLVYRHPHVFGTEEVSGTEEVLVNWETLKRREKGQRSTADAVDAVARTLPALWRAEKMQKKTAAVGFQWNALSGALDKLDEETQELRQAAVSGAAVDAPHGIREEVGDVLFIAAKIAQMSGVDPEDALHRACDKYAGRFRFVEEAAGDKPLDQYSQEELLALWGQAKQAGARKD